MRERGGRRFGVLVAHAIEQAGSTIGEICGQGLGDAPQGVEAMLGGDARSAFGVQGRDGTQSLRSI